MIHLQSNTGHPSEQCCKSADESVTNNARDTRAEGSNCRQRRPISPEIRCQRLEKLSVDPVDPDDASIRRRSNRCAYFTSKYRYIAVVSCVLTKQWQRQWWCFNREYIGLVSGDNVGNPIAAGRMVVDNADKRYSAIVQCPDMVIVETWVVGCGVLHSHRYCQHAASEPTLRLAFRSRPCSVPAASLQRPSHLPTFHSVPTMAVH